MEKEAVNQTTSPPTCKLQDMHQMTEPLSCVSGSCACGHIKFRTSAPPFEIAYCYCRECAKVSGNGLLVFAQFSRSAVQWARQPDMWKSSKLAERGMCQLCGSSLSMAYLCDPDTISLTMGVFDEINVPLPSKKVHIFLKEKASWVQVPDDGAPRHELHSINFQKQIDNWVRTIEGGSIHHDGIPE